MKRWETILITIVGMVAGVFATIGIVSPEQQNLINDLILAGIGLAGIVGALIQSFRKDKEVETTNKEKESLKTEVQRLQRAN